MFILVLPLERLSHWSQCWSSQLVEPLTLEHKRTAVWQAAFKLVTKKQGTSSLFRTLPHYAFLPFAVQLKHFKRQTQQRHFNENGLAIGSLPPAQDLIRAFSKPSLQHPVPKYQHLRKV